MKLWEIQVLTVSYVWAGTEEEARRKYRYDPCSDSVDQIQSIKEANPKDTLFEVEEVPTSGGPQ